MTNTQLIIILVFLYFGFNLQMVFSLMIFEDSLNQDRKKNDPEIKIIERENKLLVLFIGIIITICFAFMKGKSYRKEK